MSQNKKNVVIIGAGVVGLTTAIKIQETGRYSATVVAEVFPNDPKTTKYASPWAGAHHASHAAGEPRQTKMDQETFNIMWELSAPGGDAEGCFLRIHEKEIFYDGRNAQLDWMPDYKLLPEDPLLPGARVITFTTLTIDTTAYLNYLLARFLKSGGQIVRGALQHISQVVEGGAHVFARDRPSPTPVDALVVCPGLGALSLGGVEDKKMYAVRGQVTVLRAPWVKTGATASDVKTNLWTFIIPRRNGDVVIGGQKADHDWYPICRPEDTKDVLERCLALYPELAPPHIRAERTPTIDDLYPLIIEQGVGLRPARAGGIRLETDWIDNPATGNKIPMVFNYGHSGAGFQSSWGSASIAFNLLEKALQEAA